MFKNLIEGTKKAVDIAKIKVNNVKPEIFVYAGIGIVFGGAIYACIKTPKAKDIIDNHKDNMEQLHKAKDTELYSEKEYRKEVVKEYAKTTGKVIHVYCGPVIVATIGVASILHGHHMLRTEHAAILASYGGLQKAFDEYRGRVALKYGEDIEQKIFDGEEEKEIETHSVDENGIECVDKKKVRVKRPIVDPYTVIFEEITAPSLWVPNATTNRMNVVAIQAECNRMLEQNGYLFLNDVLRMLGMKETEISRKVGWIKHDPKSPYILGDSEGFVDFGLFRRGTEYASARYEFLNGDEPSFTMHFNVQGVIIDKFEQAATRAV